VLACSIVLLFGICLVSLAEARLAEADLPSRPAPTSVAVTQTGAGVQISWTPSGESDVVGVAILRDWFRPWLLDNDVGNTFIDTSAAPGRTHRYQVRHRYADGTVSLNSQEVSITLDGQRADQAPTPPSTPQPLAVSTSSSSVELAWAPSTDDRGVANYLIHRDYEYRAVVDASTTNFVDDHVGQGEVHRYQIRARDEQGAVSPPSGRIKLTIGDPNSIRGLGQDESDPSGATSEESTPEAPAPAGDVGVIQPISNNAPTPTAAPQDPQADPGDDQAPATVRTPRNLLVSTADRQVTLRWSPPLDPSVDGWIIHRDGQYLAYVPKRAGAAYVDAPLVNGASHSYQVRAQAGDLSSSPTPMVELTVGDPDSIRGNADAPFRGPGDPNGGPPAPSNYSASTSGDQVTLTWDDPMPAGEIKGYQISRDYEYVTFIPAGQANSWTDNQVAAGELHRYTMRTQRTDGAVSPSTERIRLTIGDPDSISTTRAN